MRVKILIAMSIVCLTTTASMAGVDMKPVNSAPAKNVRAKVRHAKKHKTKTHRAGKLAKIRRAARHHR